MVIYVTHSSSIQEVKHLVQPVANRNFSVTFENLERKTNMSN